MKNILSLSLLLLLTSIVFGQISEGKVKYNVAFSSSNPEVSAQLSMLSGSSMEYTFAENLTRVDFSMGMYMTTTTIFDRVKKVTTTLVSGMMGSKGFSEELSDETPEDPQQFDVEKTDETKKIKGFSCTKYILTDEEGNSFIVWATTEIVANKSNIYFFQGDYEGFPLEFECAQGELIFNFTVNELQTNLKKVNKKVVFDTEIPKNYKVVSKEDLQ